MPVGLGQRDIMAFMTPADGSDDPALAARLDSTAAELAALADAIDRARGRVGGLADPFLTTDREDIVSALYESERALLAAGRTLQRALKTLGR